MRYIWKNGKILPESEAHVSVYDSAMMFGDCVFEMTRSFNGEQFKLREHLERLFRSVKYVQIPLEMTIDELETVCLQVAEANNHGPDDEHRLMINVTRGPLAIYTDVVSTGPTVTVTDFPLRWTVAGMGKLFERGINAVIPSQRAIPAHLLNPKVKCRSRLHYMMANIEVSRFKGDNNWPLLLDENGHAAESSGANFFCVQENNRGDVCIVSANIGNALEGISQNYIFELAKQIKSNEYGFDSCPVKTMPLTVQDIYSANEAFFTATPFCMLPVTSLNGVPIGKGRWAGHIGRIYTQLLDKWSENVGVDIKAQIQAWDKGKQDGPSPYQFK